MITATTLLMLTGCAISFFGLGWVLGRRKFTNETAVMVIENLKATIEIHKATHEEQMFHLSQRYTDLKIDVMKCMEENKALMKQLEKK